MNLPTFNETELFVIQDALSQFKENAVIDENDNPIFPEGLESALQKCEEFSASLVDDIDD
jgi:hypothetical protein